MAVTQMPWECQSCSTVNSDDVYKCSSCNVSKPTSTRHIRPPNPIRGKFMDKRVNHLVQRATKRVPKGRRKDKRIKNAIQRKAAEIEEPIKSRREVLLEKKFKEKADQIAQLAQELEKIKKTMLQSCGQPTFSGLEEQLKLIGESMIFSTGLITTVSRTDTGSGSTSSRRSEASHPCPECSVVCKSAELLKQHLICHGKPHFLCYVRPCDFKATSRYYLTRHLREKHKKESVFFCPNCPLSFETKSAQTKHKLTHKKEVETVKPSKTKSGKGSRVRARLSIDESKEKEVSSELLEEVKVIEGYADDANSLDDSYLLDSSSEDESKRKKRRKRKSSDGDWVLEKNKVRVTDLSDNNDLDSDIDENGILDKEVLRKNGRKRKTTGLPRRRRIGRRTSSRKPKKERPPPKERLPCPHEGCKFAAFVENRLTEHRVKAHKEKLELPPRVREKKFVCEVCGIKATSSWYITRHMRQHTGEKPFPCDEPGCDYRAFRKSHLKRHKLSLHNDERTFQCQYCDFRGKNKDNIRAHEKYKHSEEKYDCDFCGHTTNGKEHLKGHMKRVHKYVCLICTWDFSDSVAQEQHAKLHRGNQLCCQLCEALFDKADDYITHMELVHGVIMEKQVRRVKKRSYLYTCNVCLYQFHTQAMLDNHVRRHLPDGGISCSVCQEVFHDMELLREHSENIHGFGIDAEKKRVRNKTIPAHFCRTCSYEFTCDADLQSHINRHRADGSIMCEHCSFIASEMHLLVSHYSEHHNITLQVTPRKRKNHHVCDICKYLFYTEELMAAHRRQHLSDGSIQCEVCTAVFTKMPHLIDHMMLMHSIKLEATYQRVRPYLNTCPVCNYMFENRELLFQHRKQHNDDGSINCAMCEFHAATMEELKVHMVNVHEKVLASEKKRHKRRKGDPPAPPRKRKPKPKSVMGDDRDCARSKPGREIVPSQHNISELLYNSGNEFMDSRTFDDEVNSYITPPSCAYDGHPVPTSADMYNAFDPRTQNPITANSLFNSAFQPSNPSISNVHSGHRPSNRLLDSRVAIDLVKLIPGGLSSNQTPVIETTSRKKQIPANSNQKRDRRKKNQKDPKPAPSDSTPKLKAFPGLFM